MLEAAHGQAWPWATHVSRLCRLCIHLSVNDVTHHSLINANLAIQFETLMFNEC